MLKNYEIDGPEKLFELFLGRNVGERLARAQTPEQQHTGAVLVAQKSRGGEPLSALEGSCVEGAVEEAGIELGIVLGREAAVDELGAAQETEQCWRVEHSSYSLEKLYGEVFQHPRPVLVMAPTVLVTGASRGLGLAVSNILLEHNTNVLVLTRSHTPALAALADSFHSRLVVSQGDVTNTQDQKNAVAAAVDAFGSLDALVLNAGVLEPLVSIRSVPLQDVRKLFDVNFYSCLELVQLALPHFKKNEPDSTGVRARVIFVSSGAAEKDYSGWMAYNASKAAINSFARTLANEEPSIVSVAVRPGVLDTDMQALIRDKGSSQMTEKDYKKFSDAHKNNGLLAPELCGAAIAKLALRATKTISGAFVSWDSKQVSEIIAE